MSATVTRGHGHERRSLMASAVYSGDIVAANPERFSFWFRCFGRDFETEAEAVGYGERVSNELSIYSFRVFRYVRDLETNSWAFGTWRIVEKEGAA